MTDLRALEQQQARELAATRKQLRAGKPKRIIAQRVEPQGPGQREPRVRDPAFLQWLRRLPCVACVALRTDWQQYFPIEAAHVRYSDAKVGRRNPGMQCKPSDVWATSLCRHHHQDDQHTRDERGFWASVGINPGELCPALYAAFKGGADGAAVVRRFASHSLNDGAVRSATKANSGMQYNIPKQKAKP